MVTQDGPWWLVPPSCCCLHLIISELHHSEVIFNRISSRVEHCKGNWSLPRICSDLLAHGISRLFADDVFKCWEVIANHSFSHHSGCGHRGQCFLLVPLALVCKHTQTHTRKCCRLLLIVRLQRGRNMCAEKTSVGWACASSCVLWMCVVCNCHQRQGSPRSLRLASREGWEWGWVCKDSQLQISWSCWDIQGYSGFGNGPHCFSVVQSGIEDWRAFSCNLGTSWEKEIFVIQDESSSPGLLASPTWGTGEKWTGTGDPIMFMLPH